MEQQWTGAGRVVAVERRIDRLEYRVAELTQEMSVTKILLERRQDALEKEVAVAHRRLDTQRRGMTRRLLELERQVESLTVANAERETEKVLAAIPEETVKWFRNWNYHF